MRGWTSFVGIAVVASLSAQAPPSPPPSPPQPPPTTGKCLILGQIADPSGAAVEGAVVILQGGLIPVGGLVFNPAPMAGGPRRTLTNSNGQFVFPDLPAGSYSIDASKPGYVPAAYGRRKPGGLAQSLAVSDAEPMVNVKIPIWRYATVTGAVVDEAGEPVVGVTVSAMRRVFETGHSRFSGASSAGTDDRGVYRMTTLTPGEYAFQIASTQATIPAAVVEGYAQATLNGTATDFSRQLSASGALMFMSLSSPGVRVGDLVLQNPGLFGRSPTAPGPEDDGRLYVYPTLFYPGTTDLGQAQVLQLGSGDERTGIDLQLKLVPGSRVTGTVTGPDGPAANLSLRLVSAYAGDLTSEQSLDVATTLTDAGGAFAFLGVPVGQYTLRAIKIPVAPPASGPSVPGQQPIPPGQTLWANVPVTVGPGPAPSLNVTLNGGFHISGRFVFEGTLPKPNAATMQELVLLIQPIDGHATGNAGVLNGQVSATGEISTYAIAPGKYSIRMASGAWDAMPGWTYQSSTLDGRDVGGTALDLQSDVTGLVITMTDHPSEIAGVARDAQGRPDASAAVLIISTDRKDWTDYGNTPRRLRNLRTSKDGRYKVNGLLAGEYFIVAVPDEQTDDWLNPKVLEALTRGAAKFKLGNGERKTVDVTTRVVIR